MRTPDRKRTWHWVRVLVSLAVAVGVIVFLALSADMEELKRIYAGLDYGFILLGLLAYSANYLFRALRLVLIFDRPKLGVLNAVPVACYHGVTNFVMPFRIGELALVFLLKTVVGKKLSQGTGALILVRLADFISVTLFLPFVLIYSGSRLHENLRLYVYLFIGLILAVAAVYAFLVFRKRKVKSQKSEVKRKKAGTTGIKKRLLDFFGKIVEELKKHSTKKKTALLLLLSVGIWICLYLTFYFIVLSLGAGRLNLFDTVIILALMVPVSLLPIQGPAHIGTHHAIWLLVCSWAGYTYQQSLGIAISSHLVVVSFVLFLAVAGLPFMIGALLKKKKAGPR